MPLETGISEVTEGLKRDGQDTGAQKPKESSPTRTNKLSQRNENTSKRVDNRIMSARVNAESKLNQVKRAPSGNVEKETSEKQ